jgi:hypothetical protein
MDPTMFAIMGFFLLAIILTGGFVLLIPLSRQLARFLDYRLQEKTGAGSSKIEGELRQLRTLVEGIEKRLQTVSDRQDFVEKVLESRETDPLKLPR